ncbi:MAG: DUF3592 domain-containing protein [Candidatus Kapabacteria bacterium]|jgi:hypothetical protein|nr:DUF3592 domain-containing protein [Candidatus Kapabacteria bacterium]
MKRAFYTILAALAGVLFIYVGFLYYNSITAGDIVDPIETEGVIKSVVLSEESKTILTVPGNERYYPNVIFTDANGMEHIFRELVTTGDKDDYIAGQTVSVVYERNNPGTAKMKHFSAFWGEPAGLCGLGVLLFLAAYATWVWWPVKEEE